MHTITLIDAFDKRRILPHWRVKLFWTHWKSREEEELIDIWETEGDLNQFYVQTEQHVHTLPATTVLRIEDVGIVWIEGETNAS